LVWLFFPQTTGYSCLEFHTDEESFAPHYPLTGHPETKPELPAELASNLAREILATRASLAIYSEVRTGKWESLAQALKNLPATSVQKLQETAVSPVSYPAKAKLIAELFAAMPVPEKIREMRDGRCRPALLASAAEWAG
jgi:hypothetical protein